MHHRLLSVHIVSSLVFLTPLLPRIFQKIFKIAQFSFETISAPQHAHIPSYTPQPRVPHHPPFPIPVFAVKKKSVTPTPKKDTTTTYQANLLRNSLYTKRDVDAFCEMCIWARVIRACLFFFPPNSKWLHVCASNMAGAMPEKKETHTHKTTGQPFHSFSRRQLIDLRESTQTCSYMCKAFC